MSLIRTVLTASTCSLFLIACGGSGSGDDSDSTTTDTTTTEDTSTSDTTTPQVTSCWGYSVGDQRTFQETDESGSTTYSVTKTVKEATADQVIVEWNHSTLDPEDYTYTITDGTVSLSTRTEYKSDGSVYVFTYTPVLPVCPPPSVNDTFAVNGKLDGVEEMTGTITITAVGEESGVTVPAGTFDTYTISFDQVIKEPGTDFVTANISEKHWLNAEIGYIKMTRHMETVTGFTFDDLSELTSYTLQ